VLFAGLFAGENSRWGLVYLIPGTLAFAMALITRGDAGQAGIIAGMVLAIPYWMAERKRLGKILITLASWSVAFAAHNAYLTRLQSQMDTENIIFITEYWLLSDFIPQNTALFFILAGILAVIGLGLVFVPLKKWPVKFMKIGGIALLAIAMVGGVVFIEVVGARREGNPNDIIWQAREILHGRMQDDFGSFRGFAWRQSINVIMDKPILGSGPGTFLQAMGDDWQQESLEMYHVVFDSAHNTYLQTAITLGIPALLAFLALIGSLFWQSLKKAFDRPILLAFGAATLGYLAQAFFQIDTPIDRPFMWLALGVMASELWQNKIG
jgi:O-antigen ligase